MRHSPQEVLAHLKKTGVVPTIGLQNTVKDYLLIVGVLKQAGLPVMEILYRPKSEDEEVKILSAIKAVHYWYGRDGFLVGCGTVQGEKAAKKAMGAGADFLVSNLLDGDVIRVAQKENILIIPSAGTHTEAQEIRRLGCRAVKLFLPFPTWTEDEKFRAFSIEVNLNYLNQYRGCFVDMEFIVTSGITPWNTEAFLRAGYALVVAGSIAKREFVEAKSWDAIAANARAYLDAVRSARG